MLAVQPPCVYEVGRPSTATAERLSFPLPAPGLPVPSSMIEDLSTRLGNLKYGHEHLVKKVIQVSDAEVAAGVTVREIGPRQLAAENTQIQQLQTTVTEMSSRESTLMQCYLGDVDRHVDLERKPPRTSVVLKQVQVSQQGWGRKKKREGGALKDGMWGGGERRTGVRGKGSGTRRSGGTSEWEGTGTERGEGGRVVGEGKQGDGLEEEPRCVGKSSPFKMSSFGKNFDLDFSKEKSVFTPATDSCASNLTPIDCMERVS
ncbi:hypothetical protein Tco_0365027, partial [Tanacetum coccineum]